MVDELTVTAGLIVVLCGTLTLQNYWEYRAKMFQQDKQPEKKKEKKIKSPSAYIAAAEKTRAEIIKTDHPMLPHAIRQDLVQEREEE